MFDMFDPDHHEGMSEAPEAKARTAFKMALIFAALGVAGALIYWLS